MQIVQEIKTTISRGRVKYNIRHIYAKNSEPEPYHIFVYPSDLDGINKKGLANIAIHKYGANYHQAEGPSKGPTGRAYAIPVTDSGEQMTAYHINVYVKKFMEFSQRNFINRRMEFFICDFKDHVDKDIFENIAYKFKHCYGCYFPETFTPYLLKEDLAEIALCP